MSDVDQLAAMCATPLEIECEGKKYKLAPLGLDSYAYVQNWAAQQPFVEMQSKLDAISDKKIREMAKEKLLDKAIAKSEDRDYIADKMSSSDAIKLLFGLMLRETHPDITDAEISKILSVRGLLQIRAWCESLIGVSKEQLKNSEGGKGG